MQINKLPKLKDLDDSIDSALDSRDYSEVNRLANIRDEVIRLEGQ